MISPLKVLGRTFVAEAAERLAKETGAEWKLESGKNPLTLKMAIDDNTKAYLYSDQQDHLYIEAFSFGDVLRLGITAWDKATSLNGLAVEGFKPRQRDVEAIVKLLSVAGVPADATRAAVDEWVEEWADEGEDEQKTAIRFLFDPEESWRVRCPERVFEWIGRKVFNLLC